jgi:hypothetical protein
MPRTLPLTFWLYTLLTVTAYGGLILLPGNPGYTGTLPWGWMALSLLLLLGLARGSRLAWVLTLVLDGTTLLMLALSATAPMTLKFTGLLLLQLGLVILLLSPSLRRHVSPVGHNAAPNTTMSA